MTSSDTKVCKGCGVEKGLQEFYRNKSMKDGRLNSCKICDGEYKKQWRQENNEYHLKYQKQYYQKNKEYYQKNNKQYYQKNKEYVLKCRKQWHQENKEYRLKYKRQYWQDKPEKRVAAGRKRQALKIQAVPEHLMDCPVEKKRLEAIYKLRKIMSIATGEEYHVDHMWPLSKGGPHWSGNLQVIPAKDNLEKSASLCENTKRVIEQSLMESTHEV